MDSKYIEFEEYEPGIGVLCLNRPDRYNALSLDMVEEITGLFNHLHKKESIRVVVLTGRGQGFCGGADLRDEKMLKSALEQDVVDHHEKVQKVCSAMIIEMRRLPQIFIAVVNGPAAGGGMSLAIASDVIIAGPRASFTASFINIGLTGAELGTSYILPRHIGYARAAEILLTGRTVNALEAEKIGLISMYVEDEDKLMTTAIEKARIMTCKSPLGLRLTKEALNRNRETPSLEIAVRLEDVNQSMCVGSPDLLREVMRFRDKNKSK